MRIIIRLIDRFKARHKKSEPIFVSEIETSKDGQVASIKIGNKPMRFGFKDFSLIQSIVLLAYLSGYSCRVIII